MHLAIKQARRDGQQTIVHEITNPCQEINRRHNLCNLSVLFQCKMINFNLNDHLLLVLVLFPDGLLWIFRRVGEGVVQTDETFLEVVNLVTGLGRHGGIPGRQTQSVTRERDAGRTYHRGEKMEIRLRVHQGQLGQVLRQALGFAVVWKKKD